MNNDELDAIEARENAATPGPWVVTEWNIDDFRTWSTAPTDGDGGAHDVLVEDDALFIAHARDDIHTLLVEVRRLQAEMASLKSLDELLSGAVNVWIPEARDADED